MPATKRPTRLRVVVSTFIALFALVAAGCSSTATVTTTAAGDESAAAAQRGTRAASDEAGGIGGATSGTDSTVAQGSQGSFEPTPTFLAYAADQVASEDAYRFEVFQTFDGGSLMSFGSEDTAFMSGATNGALSEVDMDMGALLGDIPMPGFNSGDMSMHMVIDESSMYIHSPLLGALGDLDPSLAFPVLDTIGAGWGRVDLGSMGQDDVFESLNELGMGASGTGHELISMLNSAGDVLEGGASEVRGVATKRLYTSVDIGDLLEQAGASLGDLGDLGALRDMPPVGVEVHVDEDDLVRRIEYTMDMGSLMGDQSGGMELKFWQRVDLFDFGEQVSINVPVGAPDVTAEFLELAELAG